MGGESDSILTSNVIEVIDATPIVSIPVVEKQVIEVIENISNTVKSVYDGLVNIFNEIIGRIFN